jgi:hypothetical protein
MKFHHIGYLVKNINKAEKNLVSSGKINQVIDPIQNAKLALYDNFDGGFIELIEPLSKESYTWNSLARNGEHYHHLCYTTELDELKIYVDKFRLIQVLKPTPALLFKNNLVTFYLDRNKRLLEFILQK